MLAGGITVAWSFADTKYDRVAQIDGDMKGRRRCLCVGASALPAERLHRAQDRPQDARLFVAAGRAALIEQGKRYPKALGKVMRGRCPMCYTLRGRTKAANDLRGRTAPLRSVAYRAICSRVTRRDHSPYRYRQCACWLTNRTLRFQGQPR